MVYPVTQLGNQWVNTYITETDMFNRIDANMNAVAQSMNTWGSGFAQFRINPQGLTTVASTNIAGSVEIDTATAWDATNKWYNVPAAGLYYVAATIRVNAGPFQLYITGFSATAPSRAVMTSGVQQTTVRGLVVSTVVRLAGTENLAYYLDTAQTLQGSTLPEHRSAFMVYQIGY